MSRRRHGGFANPEYLLTLVALGIVLAIVVPAFVRTRAKYRDLAALKTVRAAVAAYAADTKTKGPADLADLAKDGRYLKAIPSVGVFGLHEPSDAIHPLGATDDTGGWSYANWPGSPREGQVWINCTHTDASGRSWDSY